MAIFRREAINGFAYISHAINCALHERVRWIHARTKTRMRDYEKHVIENVFVRNSLCCHRKKHFIEWYIADLSV